MNTLNSLFDWMLMAGLRASLLVLAVLAAQWLLKNRLPSRWRYALWLPVLAALLVPAVPLLPSWMNWPAARLQADVSKMAVPPAPVSPPVSAREAKQAEKVPLPPSKERVELPAVPPAPDDAAPAAAPVAVVEPMNWREWAMALWLTGAAGVSLIVVVSFALTMRRSRRAEQPVEAELLERIAATARELGLRRVPNVLKSSAVVSPAVCGLWRPTLLLSEPFPQEWSADEADMVLRHELTHIRRGDLPLNALLCALLALHWFNPLLWLAFFRVRADREAACDAQVLDGAPAARRAAYGHTLLKMETASPPTGLCLGFVGILQRGGPLRDRIHAIVSQPQLNQTMRIAIALSIALLTIAGIAKAVEAKQAKTDAAVLFDPIVGKFFADVCPDYAKDAKFIVTEYQIDGLWDALGLQLFKLDCGPGDRVEIFAYDNGGLEYLKLDNFGGGGVEKAVLSNGSLYFTHGAGSGISHRILVKVGLGKDNALTQEVLGSIQSRPPGNEDKELVKKMGDVIAKLCPVKKGSTKGPAPAPNLTKSGNAPGDIETQKDAGVAETGGDKALVVPKPDLTKAKEVKAAEFMRQYAWVGKAQTMHEISYLGQQDGKAFIRMRSMSLLSGGWSERIIYVELKDLDKAFRDALPQSADDGDKKDAPATPIAKPSAEATHTAAEAPRRGKQFKGVELYARFDKEKNQWHFGLLPGTNRNKQADEVRKSMTLDGLDALLAEMKQLAPQEEVFLVPLDWNGAAVTPLDEETQKKLVEFCAKHEIILNGEGIWLQQPNRTIAAMDPSATRRELIVSQTEIDGKGLAMIAEKFPALESLELSYCGITDDDLSPLGKLKSLVALTMNDNYDMTGKSFGFVADLKNLRRLNLEQCVALTDEAVAAISRSTSLESLNLDSCKSLTAACAPHLGAMLGLKDLNLAGVGLPNAAIRDLAKIKGLTSLDIAVSKVTDEGMAAIATLPKLKRLGLRACRNNVTLKGIRALAPLRLEYLDANLTGSEDATVDEKELLKFAKETWPGSEIVVTNGVSHHN